MSGQAPEDAVERLEDVLSMLADAESTLLGITQEPDSRESEVSELCRIYAKTVAGLAKDIEKVQKQAMKERQREPDPDETYDRKRCGDDDSAMRLP